MNQQLNMIEEQTQEGSSAQEETGLTAAHQDHTTTPEPIEPQHEAPTSHAPESADESTDEQDEPSLPENPKPAPAATANTYRDIIAMRLAEKQKAREAASGGSTPGEAPQLRPMAHTSEWREGKKPEPSEISQTIQSETRAQEVSDESPGSASVEEPAAESSERISSRERARQRQRERAELRRGGIGKAPSEPLNLTPRTEIRSDTEAEVLLHEDESELTMPIEEAGLPEERPVRQGRRSDGRRRDDRPRDDRPREDRPREERPREERVREDQPREERTREDRPRDERPREDRQREDRPREDRQREERVREDRPREERQREDRPRGDRPRQDRPERAPQERLPQERAPQERPIIERREPRPEQVQLRTQERPAADRPVRAIPTTDVAIAAKGGQPKQSEQALTKARNLASKLGITVVIPLFNEQESLRELTVALRAELYKLAGSRYQIIYVNDGSTDRSADILRDILQMTSRITVLSFRRNMGKSAALAVGFREVKYGIVITMDADLQDDPAELPNLIAKLDEGYDLVTGWKKKRYDPISKTLPSKLFNRVTSFFSGIKLHDFNCGLKAYRKEVTDSLDVYGEMHRYLPALAHWKGFKVGEIPVVHHPRKFGKSKFGSSRFFNGFLDLLSIVFTNRYGKRPLHLFGTIGTLLGIIGLGINVWVSVEWAMGLTALSNRPIILLGVLLILVGVQLVSLGLLGEMIVKSTNRSSDFNAVREQGRRLPEDRDGSRQRSSREGGSREGRERREGDRREGDRREGGRREGPRREESGRDESRSRPREPRAEEGEGLDRDGQPRRMGRDRRRRPRD